MSLLMLSVLGGLLLFLVFAFFYSLTKAEKVNIYEKLDRVDEYRPSYRVSDSAFGRYCDNMLSKDKSGTFFKVAKYLEVDLEHLQKQICILGKEGAISAVEILAMKIIGLIAGLAIVVYSFVIGDMFTGLLGLIIFLSLYSLPTEKIKDGMKEREEQIIGELPQFIEQVYMCIEAGAPLQESLITVSDNIGGILGPLFKEVFVKASYGGGWEEELFQMTLSVNVEPLEDFVNDILISHAKGTSIHETLRSEVAHIHKIAAAKRKEQVSKLDTKMMLMMVVFCLIPVFLIIMLPAFLNAMTVL